MYAEWNYGRRRLIAGYRKLYEEKLQDIEGIGMVYRHEKTEARICVVSCPDVQKTFQIAFPTIPEDDTGVAHIVEHAVFCGSRKFPVKDVFAECEKGSVQTFLNAMTYPDRTVFPVASCNETDFRNLIHLYLDSVFYPLFYEKKEIFRQEGWRYEYDQTEQTLTVNGIVYNEMKGAYGSADAIFCREAEQALFTDTIYSHDSGGICQSIPELTYEAFCRFHQKYYHPSNCYIYLYGDMDYAEILEWMDREYLSQYEAGESVEFDSLPQSDGGWKRLYIPVPAEEEVDIETQSAYLLQVKAGSPLDLQTAEALDILSEVVAEVSGAPLKKALIEAGVGQSVSSTYDCETVCASWSIEVQDGKGGQLERFWQVIRDTVTCLCAEGLDKDSLLAAIHMREFSIREGEFDNPPGVEYGLQILNSWIYKESQAFLWLKRLKVCERLRQLVDTGYFETLLEQVLLHATEGVLAEMVPVAGLAEKAEQQEEAKLAKMLSSMSEVELQQLQRANERLFQYQNTPDEPEVSDCIPRLKLSDLSRESVRLYNEEVQIGQNLCVWHDIPTNGIIYWRCHFSLTDLTDRQLHLLGAATAMLGGLGTEQHRYETLSSLARLYTGGMSFYIETYADKTDGDAFTPMLAVDMRVLEGDFGNGLALIQEILTSSRFSDQKRWKELLLQLLTRMKQDLQYDSGYYVRKRVMSYFAPQERLLEQINGLSFYETLRQWTTCSEEGQAQLAEEMGNVLQSVLNVEHCILDVTASKRGLAEVTKEMEQFFSTLSEKGYVVSDHMSAQNMGINYLPNENSSEGALPAMGAYMEKNSGVVNEAFLLPGGGQHTAFGGSFKKAGFSYTGVLDVVKNILNTEYLYQTVRLKGGAYGYGFRLYTISGNLLFYSDEDPNCKETFAAYEQAAEYISQLPLTQKELEPYLIGTIGMEDLPCSARQQGEQSFNAYMNGFGEADYKQERDEIFSATVEQIQEMGTMLAAVFKNGYRCCFGSKKKLEQAGELFSVLRKIG